MPVANLDLDHLAAACAKGDLRPFDPEQGLGFTLDESTRRALLGALANTNFHGWYSYGTSAFTLAHAIGVIAEAATADSGIAITEQVRSLGLGKEIAIAFRTDRAIVFGVRYASNTPMTPGHLWGELKPWYKVLERNRRQLESWVKSADGLVSIPRAAARAPDRQSGAELLAAIIERPDDTALRLVYADVLVAQGDAQGELIQLCEQHRDKPDAAVAQRMKELERAFGGRIAGDVARLASSYSLSRGFVSQIEMAAPTFAEHGARLLQSHPIDRLDLKPVNDKALARLARAEALRGLRGLYLSQIIGHTRPMRLDDICGSPFFDALESLDIWTWVTAGDPEPAFSDLRAPRLRALHLYEVDSAPQILAGLARNAGVRLRRLEVNLRDRVEWRGVFAARAFSELGSLHIETRAGPTLLDGAALPNLVDLRVPDLPASPVGLPCVRRLAIDDASLDADGFERLLGALPNLEALQIWNAPRLDVNRALDVAFALQPAHTLAALHLPTRGADPLRLARVKERFPRDFYEVDVSDTRKAYARM